MLNSISDMRIIILILLLVTNRYRASEATSLTDVVKFEQCQTDNLGHVFLQGNDVSLRKCAAHCSRKEWCKGLAFGRNLMLCSLYNSMISWEKRQSCRGDCAVIYKENLTGMNFADVDLEELKECDEFVSVAYGIVLGNMNREGNRKQVVCNTGFKIQNGSDISQCRNGIWAPKPACVPANNPTEFCKGKQDGLYKDPVDCTKFYRCSSEVSYPEPCQSGTYFSTTLQRCDWIANVHNCP